MCPEASRGCPAAGRGRPRVTRPMLRTGPRRRETFVLLQRRRWQDAAVELIRVADDSDMSPYVLAEALVELSVGIPRRLAGGSRSRRGCEPHSSIGASYSTPFRRTVTKNRPRTNSSRGEVIEAVSTLGRHHPRIASRSAPATAPGMACAWDASGAMPSSYGFLPPTTSTSTNAGWPRKTQAGQRDGGNLDGVPVGFAGVEVEKPRDVVHRPPASWPRRGLLTRRTQWPKNPGLLVDVNEQNPQAVGFYYRHGFVTLSLLGHRWRRATISDPASGACRVRCGARRAAPRSQARHRGHQTAAPAAAVRAAVFAAGAADSRCRGSGIQRDSPRSNTATGPLPVRRPVVLSRHSVMLEPRLPGRRDVIPTVDRRRTLDDVLCDRTEPSSSSPAPTNGTSGSEIPSN
ncbi:hypothetical protein MAUB1S_04209 [Mycolicibacterium aubagnense]